MSETLLADFIDSNRETIIGEWEAFARTLGPAADGMQSSALRDHADEILTAIALDMRERQSATE